MRWIYIGVQRSVMFKLCIAISMRSKCFNRTQAMVQIQLASRLLSQRNHSSHSCNRRESKGYCQNLEGDHGTSGSCIWVLTTLHLITLFKAQGDYKQKMSSSLVQKAMPEGGRDFVDAGGPVTVFKTPWRNNASCKTGMETSPSFS